MSSKNFQFLQQTLSKGIYYVFQQPLGQFIVPYLTVPNICVFKNTEIMYGNPILARESLMWGWEIKRRFFYMHTSPDQGGCAIALDYACTFHSWFWFAASTAFIFVQLLIHQRDTPQHWVRPRRPRNSAAAAKHSLWSFSTKIKTSSF